MSVMLYAMLPYAICFWGSTLILQGSSQATIKTFLSANIGNISETQKKMAEKSEKRMELFGS